MPIAEKVNEKLKYQDYLGWPDDERWEIIDGIAYNMTPAPGVKHQSISRNIEVFLVNQIRLNKKECEVFDAPTDVILDEYNVVQPDVFVVCDKAKITDDNIKGAPDVFNWDETMRIKGIGMDIRLWEIFEKEIKEKKSNKLRETSNE